MFKVSVLTSGSKGNCFFVCTENSRILIDAGLSFKRLKELLDFFNIDPLSIDGIIISHEHTDHVGGAGVLSRKIKVPIYITHHTYHHSKHKIGNLSEDPIHFELGKSFNIKDIEIHPFTSSHDAIESSNFIIQPEDHSRTLAIATDLGYSPQILVNQLKKAHTVILESNHDVKMLMDGPYDWPLKQRIKSNIGHLSNDQAVGVVSQIMSDRLERLILAHLSEINNCPKIAFNLMYDYLNSIQSKTKLVISSQYESTPLFDV